MTAKKFLQDFNARKRVPCGIPVRANYSAKKLRQLQRKLNALTELELLHRSKEEA